MHPAPQHARSIQRQQSSLDQERDHARAKQLLQLGVIAGEVRVCLWFPRRVMPARSIDARAY